MQLIPLNTKIDFMRNRKIAMVLSTLLILASIALMATRGMNFGIDFTGGTLIEVGFTENADLSKVRDVLDKGGYGDATAQNFGTAKDVLVRLAPREGLDTAQLSNLVVDTLEAGLDTQLDVRRVEFVGPQVGEELTEDGGLAMLYALFGILIYVSLRFEWRFSLGAIAALIHDVLITLGLFSALQLDFDLPVLAALLAVIGYSLNDSIVVFDRIRENFRKMRKGSSTDVVNRSLNQTLSRTVITSATTLLVLAALFFLGGEIIHGFALALLFGVVIGTYSSIYIASSTLLAMGISKADLAQIKKEGEGVSGTGGDQV
ncbi:MAG TPA: protein translocase subunit SecF [Chromatiaceae bacterium]|jgi:preprotein translocase subunit SecF|nr:protein translocase subunit SecF [Chromatiaceae bacterium]HIB84903.1 protein translocase subunit SecF [Chromatiaceae bacterium]HIO54431.1 protein translocase subunit SecF [Chromatiales bacterium]